MIESEGDFVPEEIENNEKKPTSDDIIEVCKSFFKYEEDNEIQINGELFREFQEILSGMKLDDGLEHVFG